MQDQYKERVELRFAAQKLNERAMQFSNDAFKPR